MLLDALSQIRVQAEQFQVAAHEILSKHETASRSRVISLEASRRQLQGLSLDQSDLLREALDCIEFGLYRAAHVAAWQAYVDLLTDKLASDGFAKVAQARPKWPRFSTVEELRESTNEHELVVLARELKLIARSEVRILHGMLSERNECGHPGSYRPTLNESLGYVAKLINRMATLQGKSL
jgi:hypothetical protein